MNRKRLFIIFLVIVTIIITSCARDQTEYSTLIVDDFNGIDLENINHYEIKVDFSPESKAYSVEQKVIYVNNTKEELKEIYFHLYPNAYKRLETAPILFDEKTLPRGYTPGYIDIEELQINNRDVDFKIQGQGDTILKINLPSSLKPKEDIEIYFKYKGNLPLNIDRFGYGERVYNFGNWYPIACVYDDDGWNLDPYYNLGDPFYSDVANYSVKITVPKDMVIASSGNIKHERIKGDKKTYTIEGKIIRDFAWVASFDFLIKEAYIGDTVVKIYALEDNENMATFASEVGTESIEIFNRLFGKYPYGVYSIVMTEFPTGMEYPGIVFINKDYYKENSKDALEQVIVHETAHQWWYGVVGNDQVDEAWLDESLATYSEVIYIYNRYGKAQAENYYNYTCEMAYEYGKVYLGDDIGIKKSLDKFNGWNDYGILVYTRGAMFLNEVKDNFGMETLYDILSKYYDTYRFHHGNTEGFIKICEDITDTSFEELADEWIYNE